MVAPVRRQHTRHQAPWGPRQRQKALVAALGASFLAWQGSYGFVPARAIADRTTSVAEEASAQGPHRQSQGSALVVGLPRCSTAATGRRKCVQRHSAVLVAAEEKQLPPLLRLSHNEAFWRLARPTISIALLRSAYGVIDSFWVGRFGAAELQAMGASNFAFWVLLLLGEVASMGVHAVTAAHEGAGDRSRVGEAVVQGLWFSALCGVLALFLLPLIPGYFQLLGIGLDGQVFRSGAAYVGGLIWGVIPMTASGVLASGFKGVAELRPVLIVNLVCVALNFVIDPILIWGLFGFPAMGAFGAAIATNLSSLVATVISFRLLQKAKVPLRPARPNLRTLELITRIGLPMSLGGLLFTGIYIALGRILSSMDPANLAALGLGHRVEAIAYCVCEGFGAAAATTVGQWLGAGNAREARASAAHSAKVAGWVMLPVALVTLAFARPVVSIFTNDPTTIAAAISYLQIVSLIFPLMGMEFVMDGALTGAGDTTPSLVLGTVCNLLRIPLALALCDRFGIEGIWIAICVSTVMKAVLKWWAFRRSSLPQLAKVTVKA